jgi:hypothetical protein
MFFLFALRKRGKFFQIEKFTIICNINEMAQKDIKRMPDHFD